MEKVVTFDKQLRHEVLELLDKHVDKEGFIVEKVTNQRVLTPEGEDIQVNELAGVRKGSEIFIKSNISALIDFAKKR